MLRAPYESITVKDICDMAGVSRMSFYRYYNNKDDIFIDFCDERFEEFYNILTNIKDINFEVFVDELFKFIQKYSRQLKILKFANKESLLLNQLNNYARYVVSNLKSDYLKEQKNNPVFAFFMSGGLFNVIMYYLALGGKTSPEEMSKQLFSAISQKVPMKD